MIEHQQNDCPGTKVPCPLRCMILKDGQRPEGTRMFSRDQELKEHLKNECANMSVTCAKCDCEVAMGLKKEHDCVKALRAVITQYSKIIAQQSDVIARMQSAFQGQMPPEMTQSQASMYSVDGDNLLTSASTQG